MGELAVVFFEVVAFFVVAFSWYFWSQWRRWKVLRGIIELERGKQVGSACQPNFVHYCALAASPLLSCDVYAPVFRKKNYAYCTCTYTGGPQKKAAGAIVHLPICQQSAPSATGLGREYP